MFKYSLALIFIILTGGFFYLPLDYIEPSQLLLTISTFLFATFTGFFIARQSSRYSKIRDNITKFDGNMSFLYRSFGHLGVKIQNQAKKVIRNHYKKIIDNKLWDYHLTRKSNTITSLHEIIEQAAKSKKANSVTNFSTQQILVSLRDLQSLRKRTIALHDESVPMFLWVVMFLLAIILFISLTAIPSQYFFFAAILKASFGTSILAILILLVQFDRLKFFGKVIAKSSAQDVLDILAGKK